jgi:hypothetical protein
VLVDGSRMTTAINLQCRIWLLKNRGTARVMMALLPRDAVGSAAATNTTVSSAQSADRRDGSSSWID